MNDKEKKIAIIGLGYVGLPLAVEFGKKYITLGFDINHQRLVELQHGHDNTLEVSKDKLRAATRLSFSNCLEDLTDCNIFIITVPTPINENKQPDLEPLLEASRLVGKLLKQDDIVIYESTVYPGATEEVCVPILELTSGLKFNTNFFCGYSPERINPGDKKHNLVNIVKVTSGSTPAIGEAVDQLYGSIITAGTFKTSSMKVAEAAKVIENTQRDVNIALINELALIFNKLKIDTEEVLNAAGTKWNFLPFRPGLVGGHCIGVDPYYLTHKAQAVNYHPEIILAGRRINDSMAIYVARTLVKAMRKKHIKIDQSRVLLLGLTFKENCPDLRNTKNIDIINELKDFAINVDCYDPWASPDQAFKEYSISLSNKLNVNKYDAVIIAVGHKQFIDMGASKIRALCKPRGIIYDLKYIMTSDQSDMRL